MTNPITVRPRRSDELHFELAGLVGGTTYLLTIERAVELYIALERALDGASDAVSALQLISARLGALRDAAAQDAAFERASVLRDAAFALRRYIVGERPAGPGDRTRGAEASG